MTAEWKPPTIITSSDIVKNNSENFEIVIQAKKPRFSLEYESTESNINNCFDNKQRQKIYPLQDNELIKNKKENNQNSIGKTFSQSKSKFLGSLIRSKNNGDNNEYSKDGGTFRPRKDTINPCEDPEIFREKLFDNEREGFGWIRGVLIRCILCIFGATLFLRMSWIVGQAGLSEIIKINFKFKFLVLGIFVIILSFIVVIITAISMSAIATNGEVKSGGCYYLISRSLGPEFGGSIGLILYVANTVNASMNCVGLAEACVEVLKNSFNFYLIDGGINDVRIYASLICLILQLIIFVGTEFENRMQLALLGTICLTLISHLIGTFLPLNDYQRQRGIVGYSMAALLDNLGPEFRNVPDAIYGSFNWASIGIIHMFGIYFPAMTGIMAGANMSGDLRDPSRSIPRGTFCAIGITTLAYGWCMIITALTTVRDATGNSFPEYDKHLNRFISPECRLNDTCHYGLANDYQVMTLQGAWEPLIFIGVFATSLSSVSGCLIGAPRVFQALCADKLFPFIHPFAKGNGKNNDPFRAYFLTLLIALLVIMIGELNPIADLISNFFLAAFAITNFACFDASIAKSPGFRPGFRFYNKWLSLFGSILCVCIMFMLNWLTSLVTFFVFFLLFVFIKYNKSHINWGTSTDANRYRRALISLLKISRTEDHVKNYRPQLLVLTGNPVARQALVDFAYCISNGRSLLLCGHVTPHQSSVQATALIRKLNNRFTDWLYDQHIKAFYCAVAHRSLRAGVQCLLQTVGLGKMQPNILMVGYNSHWLKQCISDKSKYEEYMGVIADAFDAKMAVCIFRNENDGLDHSALLSEEEQLFVRLPDLLNSDRNSTLQDDLSRGVEARKVRPKAKATLRPSASSTAIIFPSGKFDNPFQIERHPSGSSLDSQTKNKKKQRRHSPLSNASFGCRINKFDQFHRPLPNTKFRTQIRGGFVDVWWLQDDGGLLLLLSHLLREHNTYLPNAKLRVFTICSNKLDPIKVYQNLVELLKKFRIHFFMVHVFSEDYDRQKLYTETLEEYEEIMELLKRPKESSDDEPIITSEILERTRERTYRYLRHRELLLEFSSASSVVLISLPTASSAVVLSPVYALWLELLSRDMPPMLFVRGNDNSVITFYS